MAHHPTQLTQQCSRDLNPEKPTISTSERARTLELSRYFQAAGIKGNHAGTDLNQGIRHPPDATLMALAQLACFRLNTKWAYVSLLDCDTQFIISEATQSISVNKPGQHDPDDGLFLGFSAHPLSFGVCPETIKIFTSDSEAPAVTTANITADKTRYVIRDFREDDDFRGRPYVEGWPHMRSYAEVPLTSASGYVLGSLCVIDDKPRDFRNREISILAEVASTIMSHLDLTKSQFERNRAERLVRGLSSYLEHGPNSHAPHPGSLATAPIATARPSRSKARRPVVSGARSDHESVASSDQTGMHATQVSRGSTPATSPMKSESASGTAPSDYFSHSEDPPRDQGGNKPPSPSDVGAAANSNDTFARAGELMRQALDLEGLAFLDAGFHDTTKKSTGNQESLSSAQQPTEASCGLLSYSGSDREDPDDSSMSSRYANFSRKLLYKLLNEHPFGHVFCFDRLGEVSDLARINSSVKASHTRRSSTSIRRSTDGDVDDMSIAEQLAAYATPGSSVIFLPLFDYQQNRWFATAIGWTNNATRVLERTDLSYLTAFGNSIMAEVLNQQATALSAAKSDFIASISHELRSPLHGILASIELLRDTIQVTPEASTMLDNANACGSMLLDTMNHLLDFAKINRLTTNPNATSDNNDNARLSTVNISGLVEEVVEGMYAGNLGQLKHNEHDHLHSDEARTLEDTSRVVVLVDIEPSANIVVRTEKGAWKRIVMNLVGNALKYTQHGRVLVQLKLANSPSADEPLLDFKPHFSLQVSDTGRGMNAEFLANKLFTPFMQENNLSPGTGLGLYIVQQLVQSLDGNIDVRSERKVGTSVAIRIPIGTKTCLQTSDSISAKDALPALDPERRLPGYHMTLSLPSQLVHDDPSRDRLGSHAASSNSAVTRTLTTIAEGWLGMEVFRSDEVQSLNRATQAGDMPILSLISAESDPALPWILQLRRLAPGAVVTTLVEKRLCHPFGPRKLSKALLQILESSTNGSSTPASAQHHVVDRNPLQGTPSAGAERPSLVTKSTPSLTTATTEPTLPSNGTDLQSTMAAPRAARHATVPETRRTHTEPQPSWEHTHYKRLLLVDDNPINLRVLASCVKKQGCTYRQAFDGQQALDMYMEHSSSIDLIFMDISMPVMDGCTSARKIRAFEQENDLPRSYIVALTALGSDVSKQQAFTSGIDAFMTKPISLKDIRELLAT